MEVRSLAFIFAMHAEAELFAEAIGLNKVESSSLLPTATYSGNLRGVEINLRLNGIDPLHNVDRIGTEAAALNVYTAIQDFKPDLIINAGTAGGFKRQGGEIGDIYICDRAMYHDHRVFLPGFENYAKGNFELFAPPKLVETLGAKVGAVTTGCSLDASPRDDELMLQNEASVKDMEAAAIASVARDHQIPLIVLKTVTDLVDAPEKTEDVFVQNLHKAAKTLEEALETVVKNLNSLLIS